MQRTCRNILVTGGSGFIGSAFIRHLLSQEVQFEGSCINLDLLTYAGNPANLNTIELDPRYIFEQGDICNQALLDHLCEEHEVDTIIHFAAESHVDRSIHGPEAFIQTNILGTFHLLEVVKRHPNIHFHHVSTDEVYGSLGPIGKFKETTPYQPNSPYSASKASSDHLVRAYSHTYNVSATISNCSNNYGPYQFPEKLIPVIVLNCLEKKPLPVYGNGTNIRDWLYVDDHCRALYLLLNRGRKGETYNIGGEAEARNIDLIHAIIHIIAEEISENPENLLKLINFVKDRPGHDQRYAIDCTKIQNEFGWKPKHLIKEGIKSTVLWYMKNLDWVQNIRTGSYRQWIDLNYANRNNE